MIMEIQVGLQDFSEGEGFGAVVLIPQASSWKKGPGGKVSEIFK